MISKKYSLLILFVTLNSFARLLPHEERNLFGALAHMAAPATPVFGSCYFECSEYNSLSQNGFSQCAINKAAKNCQALSENCVSGFDNVQSTVGFFKDSLVLGRCETRAFVYGVVEKDSRYLSKDWLAKVQQYYLNENFLEGDVEAVFKAAQIFKTLPPVLPKDAIPGFMTPYLDFFFKIKDQMEDQSKECRFDLMTVTKAPYYESKENRAAPDSLANQIEPWLRTYYFSCANENSLVTQASLGQLRNIVTVRLKEYFTKYDFVKSFPDRPPSLLNRRF